MLRRALAVVALDQCVVNHLNGTLSLALANWRSSTGPRELSSLTPGSHVLTGIWLPGTAVRGEGLFAETLSTTWGAAQNLVGPPLSVYE